MNKISVTIGISAFNEEFHISQTLSALLKQVRDNFTLDRIIVISDGSSDATVQRVKSIRSRYVQVVDDKQRRGKPNRINQIFKMSKSDVVIVVDADLIFQENNIVSKLAQPFIDCKETQLVSGYASPLETRTVSQKIANAGLNIWEYSKSIAPNSDMYYCGGPVRAFGKDIYKKMLFPDSSADDVFPYLYIEGKGYKFKYVSSTKICYRLPSSISDFIKQTRRFIKSPGIQTENCGYDVVSRNFTIDWKIKLHSAIKCTIKDPLWCLLYILFSLYIHAIELIDRQKDSSTWDIISSTKGS